MKAKRLITALLAAATMMSVGAMGASAAHYSNNLRERIFRISSFNGTAGQYDGNGYGFCSQNDNLYFCECIFLETMGRFNSQHIGFKINPVLVGYCI